MMNIKDFLNTSYTAFHATENVKSILKENDFSELTNDESWSLIKGGKYYIVKNDSAIIAFVVGDLTSYAFNIAESHTDSPCLKVKGGGLIDGAEGKRINVEEYGGLIHYSMLDTPLKVAGRVLVDNDGKVESALVESDYNVTIPSVCIHHNQKVNSELSLPIYPDMLPMIGDCDNLLNTLVGDKVVLDCDLYCVPATSAYQSGVKGEYLCSPRIDNLTSVYSSIIALCNSHPKGIAIACCFDNEEIGSGTKQGGGSSFLKNVLSRINVSLGYDEFDFARASEHGLVLSIDNGHAVHPAHPEKSDPLEKVVLNGGIVIKHHPHYSTDGMSSALIKSVLNKANIPYQDYYNNANLRCGGTIGLITSAQLEMKACDIGLAQLAMHSACEMVGIKDIDRMQKCVSAFYNTTF